MAAAPRVKTCCVVVGRVGVGKSTFFNKLARPVAMRGSRDYADPFPAGSGLSTHQHAVHTLRLPGDDGLTVDLIDIPGTDGQFQNSAVAGEYLSALELTSSTVAKYSQIAKIFLVGSIGKPELGESLRFLLQVFGPTALPHVHVVFTQVDRAAKAQFNAGDAKANRALAQRLVKQAFDWLNESVADVYGVPFAVPSFSCVAKSFASRDVCDVGAEIDYVHALLRRACRPEAPRYSVLELCRARYFVSDGAYLQLERQFEELEARRAGVAAMISERAGDWRWTEGWATQRFDTLNAVVDVYNRLLFYQTSWAFVEDKLSRNDKLQFSAPGRLDKLDTMVARARQIVDGVLKSHGVAVALLASGRLYALPALRCCTHCGQAYQIEQPACEQLVCQKRRSGDREALPHRQTGRIADTGDICCGRTFSAADARPVYLHELLSVLDLTEAARNVVSSSPSSTTTSNAAAAAVCLDSSHQFCHPGGCHLDRSALDHPRLSLKHTAFNSAALQEITAADLRYFAYGSQHVVSLVGQMFSNEAPCPPHLVDEVLRFVEVFLTDDLAFAETILSPTSAKLARFIVQNIPSKFSIGSRQRFVALLDACRADDPDVCISLVGALLSTDWHGLGKQDTFHVLLKILLRQSAALFDTFDVLRELLFNCPSLRFDRQALKVGALVRSPHELELFVRNVAARLAEPDTPDLPARSVELVVDRIGALFASQTSDNDFTVLCRVVAESPLFRHAAATVVERLPAKELRHALCRNVHVPVAAIVDSVWRDVEAMCVLAERSDLQLAADAGIFLSYVSERVDDTDAVAMALLARLPKRADIPAAEQCSLARFAYETRHEFRFGRMSLAPAYLCRKAAALCPDAVALLARADPRTRGALLQRHDVYDTPVYAAIAADAASDDAIFEGVLCSCRSAEQQAQLLRALLTKQDFAGDERELYLLECLCRNPHLDGDVLRQLLALRFECCWRLRVVIAARKQLTAEQIDALLEPPSLLVYRSLCANRSAPLTEHHLQLLSSFAVVDERSRAAWTSALRIALDNPFTPDQIGELLLSYQSQCRMLLLERHAHALLYEHIVLNWCDTPDGGVFSSMLHFLPQYTLRTATALLAERSDGLAAMHPDLLLDFVKRIITGGVGQPATGQQHDATLCTPVDLLRLVFENARAHAAALHFLDHHPDVSPPGIALSGEYSSIAAAAGSSAWRLPAATSAAAATTTMQLSFRSAVRLWQTVLDTFAADNQVMAALVGRFIGYLQWTQIDDSFHQLVLRLCANRDVEYQHVDRLLYQANSPMLMTILQRDDMSQDALWNVYLRSVKQGGFESPVLVALAQRSVLPEELRWALALVQSRLGRHSIYELGGDTDALPNELFKSFLRTDAVLPDTIVAYYLACEPATAVELIRSTFLSARHVCHAAHCLAPSVPAVRDYLLSFLTALRQLTGVSFGLGDFPFERLPSSAVFRKTIAAHEHGISLADLLALFGDGQFPLQSYAPPAQAQQLRILADAVCAVLPPLAADEPPSSNSDDDEQNSDDDEQNNDDDDDSNERNKAPSPPTSPSLSLRIRSLGELQDRLAEMLVSFDVRVFLPQLLDSGVLAFQDVRSGAFEAAWTVVGGERYAAALFRSADAAQHTLSALNQKISKWLAALFTAKTLARRQRPAIAAAAFRRLLNDASPTVRQLAEHYDAVGFARAKYLTELIEQGFGDEPVRDVHHMQRALRAIARQLLGAQRFTKISWPLHIQQALLRPALTGQSLPYSAVYALVELFPVTLKARLPVRTSVLLSVWQRPHPSDGATVASRAAELSDLLDLYQLDGVELLRGVCALPAVEFPPNSNVLRYVHRYSVTDASSSSSSSSSSGDRSLLHSCTLTTLRVKLWQAVLAMARQAVGLLQQLRTRKKWRHNDARLGVLIVEAAVQDVGELEMKNLLSRELLGSLLTWHDRYAALAGGRAQPDVLSRQFTVANFAELIEPFAGMLAVHKLQYMFAGRLRTCSRSDASPLLRLSAVASADAAWGARPLRHSFVLVEVLELWDATAGIKSNSIAALERALAERDFAQLSLPSARGMLLVADPLPSDQRAVGVFVSLLHGLLAQARQASGRLAELCRVQLLSRLHPTLTRTAVRVESVQATSVGLDNLHPYVLDDDSLPQIDPDQPTEWLRDRSRPKQRMPVEFPRRVEYETPVTVSVDEPVSDLLQLAIRSVDFIHREFSTRVDHMIAQEKALALSCLGSAFCDALIARIDSLVERGFAVKSPDGCKFRAYPLAERYRAEIDTIRALRSALEGKSPFEIIAAFRFSRRPSLVDEMARLVRLVRAFLVGGESAPELGWSPEDIQARYFELAFATAVCQSDPNYWDIFDRFDYIKAVPRLLALLVRPLQNKQAIHQDGYLCAAFRASPRDVVFLVSDHEQQSGWTWRLQHNPNACASMEFAATLDKAMTTPTPYDFRRGEITLFEVLFTPFGEVLLMFWSTAAVERIRRETDAALRVVIAEDAWTSEPGYGNRAAGKVNWYGGLNHFSKEIARLNASTEVYLRLDEGVLVPEAAPDALLAQLEQFSRQRSSLAGQGTST